MMTSQELDQLLIHNTEELNKLNVASGSMIKAVLQGIVKNGSGYIRLHDATEGGHKVSYVHVEGDESLVTNLGEILGLMVTDTSLEAPHA